MKKNYYIKRAVFETLVAENSRLINKICYMYATNMDNFNDLQQEVLINIWQSLDSFDNRSKMSTWIYRVSLNTCITYTSKERKHSSHEALSDNLYSLDDTQEHLRQLQEMYELINKLNIIKIKRSR